MAQSDKERLVDFLERRAFKPVLGADKSDYSGDDQDKLEDVQSATRNEVERYHDYDSDKEVYRMFQDDLNSEEADEVNRKLKDLDLPRLCDIKDEFEAKAKELEVCD